MKKISGLILLIFTISCLFAACYSKKTDIEAVKSRGVLNVGVKVDVPKFGYKDPKTNKIEGFEVDLAKEISQKILGKQKLKLKPVNAKTRGPMLDNGEVDIVAATFTITEERKKSYNFSKSYFKDHVALMVNKGSGIKSLKDLDGKKIGIAQSATTKKSLEQAGKKDSLVFDFMEFATYPEIKSALKAKRIDCFSVDMSILSGYLDKSTEILEDRYQAQDYGIAIKLSNKKLTNEVNKAIDDMKSNGKIKKLLKKWEIESE